jgi:hypothetical protein
MALKKIVLDTMGAAALIFIAVLAVRFLRIKSAEASSTELSKTYANAAYSFELKMPEDFSAWPPNGTAGRDASGALTGQLVVLQNLKGDAIQLAVTPDDRASPDNIFNVDDLEREAPYVDVSQAQPVQLAQGVTGMTFTEGPYPPATASTDVLMFTYRGNLYVLSADTKDRALFEATMDTWTFI